MSRILIIEDEESIAELEKDYLELEGFEVIIETDGKKGLKRAKEEAFDLFILDLMLPGIDGFQICREIREVQNTPIIMVSAKKEDVDKITGLGLGADDYMTKPFSPSELVARVKAHMARYERLVGSNQEENNIIEIRGIKIDKTSRRVWVNGTEKVFTNKEFDLLPVIFYGHPQNRFWPLLAALFGENAPGTVEEKKALALRHRVALWDTIYSCDILGSSDSSIRAVVPTDLRPILARSGVTRIFCNGRTSGAYYKKYQEKELGIEATVLPSTSPANAAWTMERLMEAWRVIREM